ncbi:ComF family protein [Hahella sp. CR1]|uniref:ComF family protein n=1 Tax=Hahella sp. CR1 TaxID=2992807 RepID=UPI002441B0E6|nr:ComF family protein [Hahella sp. CR1]MDG9671107.1 ComF family protein [Hahella sp. CR1]
MAPDTAPCGRCLRQPPYFDASTSAFDYSFPLNQVIGQLKYGDKRYWARALAQAALPAFEQACAHISAPVLVPVPMHKSKQRKRGFNQAELLARSLARYADVAFSNKLCKRIKASPPQTGLNRKNRRSNVKNGFAVSSKLPQQPLIIIDDVVTTGSTVDELARTLKQAGALEVYVFSIARRSMD